jgi:hypothetical protein
MPEDLRTKIQNAAQGNRLVISAETYLGEWPTSSKPVKLHCGDKNIYVVKGSQNKKSIVNEHVVGKLGQLLGAPVPNIEFIDIPPELRNIEPKLHHIGQGLAHGTLFLPDCTDRTLIDHANQEENKLRFAYLMVLYSWIHAGDHQLIYGKFPPNLVYSVDHGLFFPGGSQWTPQSLLASQNLIQLDPLFTPCGISPQLLFIAGENLNKISDEDIQLVVNGPPEEWGIFENERKALFDYLNTRRLKLIEMINGSI